jgi:DNA polymerase elongation subunit (family B)
MKSAKGEEYKTLDAKQLFYKLLLNSLYGKFAYASEHDVTKITSDNKIITDMMAKGLLKNIEQINEKYIQYSGIEKCDNPRTNFMLASFITARGRIHLIKSLYQLDKAKANVLYTDTDSAYFQVTPQTDMNVIKNEICKNKLFHETGLGDYKLEMDDNFPGIKNASAEIIVFGPKFYVMRCEQNP